MYGFASTWMEPPTYLSPSPASEVRGVLVVPHGLLLIATEPFTKARFSRPVKSAMFVSDVKVSEPQTCVRPLSWARPAAVVPAWIVTLPRTTEHPSAPFAVASGSLLMTQPATQFAGIDVSAQMFSKSISSSNVTSWGQNTQSVCAVVAPASSRSMAAARIMVGQPLCCVRGQHTLARDYGPAMRLRFCTQLLIVFARCD